MQVQTDSPAQVATKADTALKKITHLAGTRQQTMDKCRGTSQNRTEIAKNIRVFVMV